MPPIEFSPNGPRPVRAIGKTEARTAPGPVANDTARTHASPNSAVVRSSALVPGPVPIDGDRVSIIRKAIQTGTYPLIPTRVADAMIAAGMLLRGEQP